MLRNQRVVTRDLTKDVSNQIDGAEETAKLETLQVLREAIHQQREFINDLCGCRPVPAARPQPNQSLVN